MDNQQILQKAIQKAIDGGWIPEVDPTQANWEEPGNEQLLPSIIFNHDFAKALFGIYPIVEAHLVPPIDFEPFQDRSTVEVMLYSTHRYELWKYHLQQMVIAEDPIKYLGENI